MATTLPPQLALMQLTMGFYVSRALWVAATLRIADRLADGPKSAAELAAASETNADALRRVLRLLVSVGVFAEQEDGRFGLAPLGDCLRSDVPGSMRAATLLFAGTTQDAWQDLLYCVQTGEPAFPRVFGMGSFEYMEKHPDRAAVFDAAMADFTKIIAVAVAAAYDFSPFRTVVDVGGGNGTLLAGLLSANPSLRGVVVDLPHVVERTRANLAAQGLGDRCEARASDIFAAVPEGGDAYLLKHVIHDWDDERATAILANCRRAMRPDARVLIVEGVYPPHVEESPISRSAASNDVNMLVCTGGRQRSEEEFRALYERSGFRLTRIVPTMVTVGVVEGQPV